MVQALLGLDEVAKKIKAGGRLLLAGDQGLLQRLPKGNWIGGSIPYFMADRGGTFSESKIFVTELPQYVGQTAIEVYDPRRLPQVYQDTPENGFSFIIIPGMSQTHLAFAVDAPGYKGFARRPLVGWIAGVNLDRLGQITPKVVNGATGEVLESAALVMHISLPSGKAADVRILNIFEPGDGDVISFSATGFSAKHAIINGKSVSFADYLEKNAVDTRMPLVANYGGAFINISFQKVDRATGQVSFYAPVFQGMEYRLARSLDDYVRRFTERLPAEHNGEIVFSCNCILNYLHSKLEGKKTGAFLGPITFGEVAYQLVNQTLAYLIVMDR
jgi:hypothetical protein